MQIKELKDCVEFKETVITWMNQEFGSKDSMKFFQGVVEHSSSSDGLPKIFVAVEDGVLLGTAGIWRGDLLSRQDLFPWFSALIVNQEYRNQHIGQKLQEHVLADAKTMGYKEIFLYTDLVGYYEKGGWKKIDVGYEYTGTEMTIYRHVI
ncbi:MAG: GNAT family N-acetyltransferase [Lachnospiraceae bacterium]|nr:GNAT family N-acetyltransferase [Lachnospiraceae bacterium]